MARGGGAASPVELGPDDAPRGGRPRIVWNNRLFIGGEGRRSMDSVSMDVSMPDSVGGKRASNDDPSDAAAVISPPSVPRGTPAPTDIDAWPMSEPPTRGSTLPGMT